MPIFQYLRRQWISRRPFPEKWVWLLRDCVPFYRRLPESSRQKLKRHIQIFCDEKLFEGCGGLELTEEMKLVIAAHACLLLLEEPSDYYPSLKSILVYPDDYMAPVYAVDAGGVVTEGWESRSGESWNPGNIVLSWSDIRRDIRHPNNGRNLVFHEFAHQLDYQYGLSDGIDLEGQTESDDEWTLALARVYRELLRKEQMGKTDLLDGYGATNPAECFAVIIETFLERPRAVRKQYTELYRHLVSFFGFDSAELFLEPELK